jgi:hypothetical protein
VTVRNRFHIAFRPVRGLDAAVFRAIARLLLVGSIVVSASSCSTTDVKRVWKAESPTKVYSNVLVAAAVQFPAYRKWLEQGLVSGVKGAGADATAEVDLIDDDRVLDKETAVSLVRRIGADSVLVVKPLDMKAGDEYVPGKVSVVTRGYVGGWYGYYARSYRVSVSPGYMAEFREFTVETTLFDAATSERVWSIVTVTSEIRDLDAILSYVRKASEELGKSGLFE